MRVCVKGKPLYVSKTASIVVSVLLCLIALDRGNKYSETRPLMKIC